MTTATTEALRLTDRINRIEPSAIVAEGSIRLILSVSLSASVVAVVMPSSSFFSGLR